MPRIWIDYCQFIVDLNYVTKARHTLDRALRSLPITQHCRIWPIYLNFIKKHSIKEQALRLYRRYLQLAPDDAEVFKGNLLQIYCAKVIIGINMLISTPANHPNIN